MVPTQHVARIAANILPNIVYPAIQSSPHRRRSEDIIYQRHAQDTDRDRRHSVRHRREHTLRRIDIVERNDCDRVTGQHGGVGLIAAEVACDENTNAYPAHESAEHTDPLAGKKTGDHDGHGGAYECRRDPVSRFGKCRPARRLRQDCHRNGRR